MKKLFLIALSFLFLGAYATTLKAGVQETYIPDGFFGSWGVISKLKNSNNPSLFNRESRDIWVLSGYGNTLILENLKSGAHSQIQIKEKNKDGKTLKFERIKKITENDEKVVYREIVSFVLNGNNFSGTDNYIVEKYDKTNVLKEKNEANYVIEGVKISGTKPN